MAEAIYKIVQLCLKLVRHIKIMTYMKKKYNNKNRVLTIYKPYESARFYS